MIFFNYPKLKTICREEESFLILKIRHSSVINETFIQFTINNNHSGFLPVSWTKNRANEYFSYNISSLVELSEYLRSEISDEKFLSIVSQIVDLIKICHQEDIPSDNILLRLSSIYYNPSTQKINVIYLPLSNVKINKDTVGFFNEIYTRAKIRSTNNSTLNKYCKIVSDSMLLLKKKSQKEALSYFLKLYSTEINDNINHQDNKDITMTAVATELLNSITASVSEISSSDGTYELTDSEHTVLLEPKKDLPYLTDESGNTTELTQFPFSIGRNRGNDLQLNIPTISGRHAQITLESDTYYINDLNSGNGTFLNKFSDSGRIRRARLNDGDCIYIYQTQLIFHSSDFSSTVLCNDKKEKCGELYCAYTTQKYTAYIVCQSTQKITSIFSFPFQYSELSGIIFENRYINGKKKYLIKNLSCDNIKIEGILLDQGTDTELFSGCSFSVSDMSYSFFIVN